MNKAAAQEPRSGHDAPAGSHLGKRPVGANDTKADMRGALTGNPEQGNPLSHAKHELHKQHPIPYHDHGPHHGTDHHIRHKPLHGMKPSRGYSR